MPTALKLGLTACEPGKLPRNQGPAVHGLFLAMLRDADAGLAGALHRGSGAQPFTLSPPYRPGGRPGCALSEVKAGDSLCVRLCILDDSLIQPVYGALLAAMRKPVRLCGCDFRFGSLRPESAQTYEEMAHAAENREPPRRFRLNFLTPACFKHEGRSALFPQPDFILGGLARRWSQYAGQLGHDTVRQAAKSVYAARYELRTGILEMNGTTRYLKTGFTGYCVYETGGLAPEAGAALNKLLALLEYAGIGYKTTMGMGQSEYRPLP
jgi:CRISPR-associated endoribonuclease Cas6